MFNSRIKFNSIKTVRKYHKWLMAFVGLQFLIWSTTGLYMVAMDIHFIHGETLITKDKATIKTQEIEFSIAELLKRYPQAQHVSLTSLLNAPVYQFKIDKKDKNFLLVSATNGELLPLIGKLQAQSIAQQTYAQSHNIEKIELLTQASNVPAELSARHLPAWRIEFDHFSSPTLYVTQYTGAIVTKRHTYWRLFDWMWRFHITDYDDGENVSNWFLLLLALSGCISAIAGAVLTYFRVIKSQKNKQEAADVQ